jgi:hypothetical protein
MQYFSGIHVLNCLHVYASHIFHICPCRMCCLTVLSNCILIVLHFWCLWTLRILRTMPPKGSAGEQAAMLSLMGDSSKPSYPKSCDLCADQGRVHSNSVFVVLLFFCCEFLFYRHILANNCTQTANLFFLHGPKSTKAASREFHSMIRRACGNCVAHGCPGSALQDV